MTNQCIFYLMNLFVSEDFCKSSFTNESESVSRLELTWTKLSVYLHWSVNTELVRPATVSSSCWSAARFPAWSARRPGRPWPGSSVRASCPPWRRSSGYCAASSSSCSTGSVTGHYRNDTSINNNNIPQPHGPRWPCVWPPPTSCHWGEAPGGWRTPPPPPPRSCPERPGPTCKNNQI